MSDLADTNMLAGSDVCYVVLCTKSDGKTKSIFKNYGTDRQQAEIDLAALLKHQIAAELIEVGKP